jgi:hypothetical protein
MVCCRYGIVSALGTLVRQTTCRRAAQVGHTESVGSYLRFVAGGTLGEADLVLVGMDQIRAARRIS